MANIKYYPLSRMQTNLHSRGNYTLNGKVYRGPYYLTYNGRAYTGSNPIVGDNELLTELPSPTDGISNRGLLSLTSNIPDKYSAAKNAANNLATGMADKLQKKAESTLKQVVSYYPLVTDVDYNRGYFIRYFAKRIADKGYIIEIDYKDWNLIKNGSDPTYLDYEVESVMWQLTGPLKDTRVSQYQIKGGIETTNKRITEQKAKTFIGLVEFIGGDYTKFAKIDK